MDNISNELRQCKGMRPVLSKVEKTILEKAQDIVYNRMNEDGTPRPYGPFSKCMEKATEIFNAINPFNDGHTKDMRPEEMYFALTALKFAREFFQHKQDNLIDACGYIAGLDDYIKELQERGGVDGTAKI